MLKYAGIKGITHGAKKEISPARNINAKETFFLSLNPAPLASCCFKFKSFPHPEISARTERGIAPLYCFTSLAPGTAGTPSQVGYAFKFFSAHNALFSSEEQSV